MDQGVGKHFGSRAKMRFRPGGPVQCWLDVDPGLDEKIEIKYSRINLNVRSII